MTTFRINCDLEAGIKLSRDFALLYGTCLARYPHVTPGNLDHVAIHIDGKRYHTFSWKDIKCGAKHRLMGYWEAIHTEVLPLQCCPETMEMYKRNAYLLWDAIRKSFFSSQLEKAHSVVLYVDEVDENSPVFNIDDVQDGAKAEWLKLMEGVK